MIRTVFVLTAIALPLVLVAAPAPVRLVRDGDRYELLRDGKPYFVKGVGGQERLAELARLGGNSIRTWGPEGLGSVLDRANALGLTVTAGIWLGHERHGFRYDDPGAVRKQLEQAKAVVAQFKDHPALLMWGLGNEMEGDGANPTIWRAVEDVAKACKAIDPNHPTMTVIAEVGGQKVPNLHKFCPSIDIVGINSYAGMPSVIDRYRESGGTKPVIITEFGPRGQWEVGKLAGRIPVEQTSTEKAAHYRTSYEKAVLGNPGFCLGAYAFLWGCKQEATATWFGMFLSDGARTAAVEAMSESWGGPNSENRCPTISVITLDRQEGIKPGERLRARVSVADPDGDTLDVRWALRREAGVYATGGDGESALPGIPDAVERYDASSATVSVPESGGGYRLFAYAYDGKGNAAVANTPFIVDGPAKPLPPPKAALPLAVYTGEGGETPYTPSGYMGNTGAIEMDPSCTDKPAEGRHCLRVHYSAADNWGGVVWQSPPNDWGDQAGGFDLTGATDLRFRVRGAQGNEVVLFGVGLIDGKPYSDSGKAKLEGIRLTPEWQTLYVPLHGRDLTRIKSGFYWTIAGQGHPVTFYLDDIRFVKRP